MVLSLCRNACHGCLPEKIGFPMHHLFDIDFYLFNFFFIYASAQNYVCHIDISSYTIARTIREILSYTNLETKLYKPSF